MYEKNMMETRLGHYTMQHYQFFFVLEDMTFFFFFFARAKKARSPNNWTTTEFPTLSSLYPILLSRIICSAPH